MRFALTRRNALRFDDTVLHSLAVMLSRQRLPLSDSPTSVRAILDILRDLGEAHQTVTIATIVEKFGDRSYGPALLVPALIGLSPIGAVPGIPAFLSGLIALVAIQLACGRTHLWLPGFVNRRSVPGERLRSATAALSAAGRWLDTVFHGRLERLTDDPFPELAAGVTLVMCVLIVPLELLPFAVALPMGAIAAFGLALTVRDGVLMLVSLAGAGLAAYLALAAFGPG